MTAIPITFAKRGDELVHISDVANGLGCDCICPACGDRMIARQGAITIHHFAHEGGSDCAGGLQTALHLAAKAVLSKERWMVLPAMRLTATARDTQGVEHAVSVEAFPPRRVVFDEVTEEKRLGDIIPDLICRTGGRVLLVEVAVTHFVDDIKREKIRALGVACVEIDLSGMVSGWDWPTLTQAIVQSVAGKSWIDNPKADDLRAELQRQAQQKAVMADRFSYSIEQRKKAKRMNTPGLDDALRRFEEFERSGEPQHERDALNRAGPDQRAWISAARLMNLEWDDPPNYIDIEVPGESVFLIARKVWQAALYAFFIPGQRNKTISGKTVAKWCAHTFPLRTEFRLLQKHTDLLTPSQREALPGIHKAVTGYLMALADLGYLKKSGDSYYLQLGAPHWKPMYIRAG